MANAFKEITDHASVKANYTEIELELDDETYRKLIFCQKKLNVSVDEIIRQSIFVLEDEILK